MKIIHIQEPFWGGGSVYGWGKGIPGIGIRDQVVMEALRTKENIRVKIGKDPQVYEISPTTVVNLMQKYRSIKTVRYGVKVAVVPQNQLKKSS